VACGTGGPHRASTHGIDAAPTCSVPEAELPTSTMVAVSKASLVLTADGLGPVVSPPRPPMPSPG
jgi:hypothetical protein